MEQGMQGNGVVTDLDGNFTLNLKGNGKKITVSYIGMKTQTIDAAGKSMLHVTLEDAATSLNDVVVIGYGTVKKKDLTGSGAAIPARSPLRCPLGRETSPDDVERLLAALPAALEGARRSWKGTHKEQ